MMKSEFEEITKKEVTEIEYKKIDTVYLFYPGIQDKSQIADIFKIGGMMLINDMLPRAKKI